MSSESQCHDATCWWKGLDLSYIVCEYEVNPLTNDKSYYRNPKLQRKIIETLLENNVKCQGHLQVKIIIVKRSWPKQQCM